MANPLKIDPTRSTTLRRQFIGAMRKRFRRLRGDITRLVVTEDVFGITAAAEQEKKAGQVAKGSRTTVLGLATVLNTRWRFESDSAKVEKYQDWLKERVENDILEVSAENATTPWLEPYIQGAYKKGVVRGYVDGKASTGQLSSSLDFIAGGKEEFLRSAFGGPVGQTKLRTLSTRAFSQLKGVTQQMDAEMSRTLADGIAQGIGARELARRLNKNVSGLEKKRALTIARTEIVHAHAEGQLDSFELLGVEEVGVLAEWQTAHDDKVCKLCQPLEGAIFTVKEARGLIPRHPNCRCAWIPANVGEHIGGTTKTTHAGPGQGLSPPGTKPTGKTTGQRHSKDVIQERLRRSIKAEHPKLSLKDAKDASRWVGADLKVTGKLKPGSKAHTAAVAAKKAAKATEKAAKKKAAQEAAEAAKAAHSLKVKTGMAKKKLGLTSDDLWDEGELYVSIKDTKVKELAKTAGVVWEEDDFKILDGVVGQVMVDDPGAFGLAAEVKAVQKMIAEKVAAKEGAQALAQEAAEQAAKEAADLVTGAAATVKGYKAYGKGFDVDALDEADYSVVPGWGAPPKGKSQSYGLLVFDEDGRILMREPTGHFGGVQWTFAKGGGTKPASTALAELAEETGHKGAIMDILPGAYVGKTTKTNYFIGKSIGYDSTLMDAETQAVKWMSYAEAREAIKLGKASKAVQRDLDVLEAAYKHAQAHDDGPIASLVAGGKAVAMEKTKAAKKAAHAHNVKAGMAKKHYSKPKFGGGVVDADWVDAKKTKLNKDGVDKVLSEKGWHTTTLPPGQADAILQAGDVVEQKALMDGLKKAPKGTPPPVVKAEPIAGTSLKGAGYTFGEGKPFIPLTVDELDPDLVYGGGGIKNSTLSKWADGDEGLYQMLKDAVDDVPAPFNEYDTAGELDAVLEIFKANGAQFVAPGKTKSLSFVDASDVASGTDEALDAALTKGSGLHVDLIYPDFADHIGAAKMKQVPNMDPAEVADLINGFKAAYPSLYKGDGVVPVVATKGPVGTLVKQKDLSGSTRPYLAVDDNGAKWVVKDVSVSGIDPDHLRSEALADELYRRLGLAVPDSMVLEAPGGPQKVAAFFDDAQTLAAWKRTASASEVEAMHKELRKGFVADALFANHDVAGMSNDNILVVAGKPYRIDNGGALTFRAQGGAKGTWGRQVRELASMRDPKVNANTAAIYAGITDDEIHQQIRHIVAHREQLLAAVEDDAVRKVLGQRIDDLKKRLPADAPVGKVPNPVGARRAAYGITPELPERVKAAKSNGVTISGDRGDIEDNNILVWEEIGPDGPQLRVQLKTTDAGSAKVEEVLGTKGVRKTAGADTHPEDNYFEGFLKAAKTVSVHAKDGQYNPGTIATFESLLETAQAKLKTAKGETKKMLKHYVTLGEAIQEAKANRGVMPAGSVSQFVVKPKAKRARRRFGEPRIEDNINFPVGTFKDGTATINRSSRPNTFEASDFFAIDAGDGTEIRFIPRKPGVEKRLGLASEGSINITLPGAADQTSIKAALDLVEDLGIDVAPPTADYEELLYLHRTINLRWRNLTEGGRTRGYREIFDADIPDAEKVVKVKAWVKKNMDIDVDKLPPGVYDPAGYGKHLDGSGFRTWNRWDITEDQIREEMAEYSIQYTTGGLYDSPNGNIAPLVDNILKSGGEFTSTTGRMRKGVPIRQTGDSTAADMRSGGASYAFTRIRHVEKEAGEGVHGFFFRPSLLARQDAVSYPRDNYGAINVLAEQRGSTFIDFKSYATKHGNETNFKEGVSIADIDFIRCRLSERQNVIDAFAKHGITHTPDGRAIEDIVITTGQPPPSRANRLL